MSSNEEELQILTLRMMEYEKAQKDHLSIGKEYKMILEEYLEKIQLSLNNVLIIRDKCTKFLERLAKIPSKLHFKRNIMIAALIYLSCKEEGIIFTFKELSIIFEQPVKLIIRCCRLLIQKLDIDSRQPPRIEVVKTICDKFELTDVELNLIQKSVEIGEKFNYLQGERPNTIAAVVIYFIFEFQGTPVSKKQILSVTNVNEQCFSKCYHSFERVKNHLNVNCK